MNLKDIEQIDAKDFIYDLPEAKIAKFPLEKRDESKLLLYKKGSINHHRFKNIASFFDDSFVFFFNNTKVIPARLFFRKEGGGLIEVFLLSPITPSVVNLAMTQTHTTTWKCLIGGLKKWKDGQFLQQQVVIDNIALDVKITLIDRAAQTVQFEWSPSHYNFATVVEAIGNIPLPPYLNREVEADDKASYQTVYAAQKGAVAAPTAGLHFTDSVLEDLDKKGVKKDFVTLHVGGGTFQPIKTNKVVAHAMHAEQIILNQKNIEYLATAERICAVGTTSLRTIESIYWVGLKILEGDVVFQEKVKNNNFFLEKLTPYTYDFSALPSRKVVFESVLTFMKQHNLTNISGETQIMIVPSYAFQCCDALITNFHQPETTLMLLVAAFVGEDWRKIYAEALANDYRFLSFGDSSLLFRS
jgi:S-adenosylmethionine:tRNA ribosyltransferase-isomerase